MIPVLVLVVTRVLSGGAVAAMVVALVAFVVAAVTIVVDLVVVVVSISMFSKPLTELNTLIE